MTNAGKNIVEGLWNGIKNAKDWLLNKVKGFANGIVDGIKDTLGIHSPSKVSEKQIGANVALGVGKGFIKNIGNVYKKMQTAVDVQTQKLSAKLSTSVNSNKVFTANINLNGDINMDSTKVGRLVAPAVSKTFRKCGAYN